MKSSLGNLKKEISVEELQNHGKFKELNSELKEKYNLSLMVLNALSEVGLAHRKNSKPDELSGGEKQRVAIARAVINEPILLLADEPTGNLDPETSHEIVEIFRRINSKGTAVLFATHNYEIVKRYDAKIIKVEDGKAYRGILKQKTE